MFELRDYQQEAANLTLERLGGGHRPIVCAPTGSGKTVIAAHLAKDSIDRGEQVLFMSGRREILEQARETFRVVCGPDVGLLMGSHPFSVTHRYPVVVASWDTLKARWNRSDIWRIRANRVLVDECHLALSPKMAKTVLPHYEDREIVGFTATPARQSGKGLGSFFTRIIQVRSVQQIIDDGFLAPCEYWAGSTADVSRVRTVKGDFENKGLSRASNQPKLIGDIVENWLRLAGDRHSLVFAVDIAHAEALAARFQQQGVKAEVVHSKMAPDTRAALTTQFKRQEFQVLVNVGIATYGYDVPSIGCVVLARPTKSIVLHLQMIGRGMRPKPDGGFCRVLDHADNVRRLGAAEDPIRWRLDSGRRAATNWKRHQEKQEGRDERHIACGDCGHLFTSTRVCPMCGWEKPAPKRDVAAVDADLVKLTKPKHSAVDKHQFYLELRWLEENARRLAKIGKGKPWHAKRVLALYKTKFDEWPDWAWQREQPVIASAKTERWVTSQAIRYAKRKRAAA